MKRSEINAAILRAQSVLETERIALPDFTRWQTEEWRDVLPSARHLRETMLGWDVTDFGSGDFSRCGAALITLRNGVHGDADTGTPYAEKLMVLHPGQEIPLHFHIEKTEDIINRGSGILALELYNAAPDDTPDRTGEVVVRMDGVEHRFPAGSTVTIPRGNSITLTPRLYHRIFAAGERTLVAGEVSSVNDDAADNTFYSPTVRFSEIVEDEPAILPLCNEYSALSL